jgi:hypothetical protein
VAWQACEFANERFLLGPSFYCPTCEHNPQNDKYRDLVHGCPKCPLMETFGFIRVDEATELINSQGGFPEGWNIDSLNHLHTIVSNILHENGDRIHPHWSITFAELCRIILQERAQTEFEAKHKQYVQIKAMNQSNQRRQ